VGDGLRLRLEIGLDMMLARLSEADDDEAKEEEGSVTAKSLRSVDVSLL
jgi:hypothetical protein